MSEELKPGVVYKADELPEKIEIQVTGAVWALGRLGDSKCLFLMLENNQVITVGMNNNRAEREDIYQYVLDMVEVFKRHVK